MNYESTYGSDAIEMGYKSAGHRVRFAHDILTDMERQEREDLRQQRNWMIGLLCSFAATIVAANAWGL
jgi:hypothetical protein